MEGGTCEQWNEIFKWEDFEAECWKYILSPLDCYDKMWDEKYEEETKWKEPELEDLENLQPNYIAKKWEN